MKAVVTVVGEDRVGIIAEVCTHLANYGVNVLDISQTVMEGFFTMMMVVETEKATVSLAELAKATEEKGKEFCYFLPVKTDGGYKGYLITCQNPLTGNPERISFA